MKAASIILQFAGLALLFHGNQAFLGLKASVTFGTTLSASTTKLSAGFATAGTNIDKILVQANLLKIPLTQSSVDDLKTIKVTFAYFGATYVALGAAFMNATGPATAVTTFLSDGVKYLDTFLPAFGAAMKNLETLTSVKMLQYFPSESQQQDLKTAFFNVFTAALTLTDKVGVTTADINAVLVAADLKAIQDFYDFYNSAIASVNIQLTIILSQYTGLVTIQGVLVKAVATFPNDVLTWNGKVVTSTTKVIPTITASLAAELKAEQAVVAGILTKLVSYIDSDAAGNIPGAVANINGYIKKLKASINNATLSINTAAVAYTDFGQNVTDELDGMGTIAVNSVVEIVAQRIFSSSNVLALKCLTSMQPNFVKDMGSTNVDIFRCMNDVLNYLPQSNDFITFEIAALKAIAAWRLGAVLTCTKYITAVSTDTTAATAFGPCLSKTSGYLNDNFADIGALVSSVSDQISSDLTTVTTDYGKCYPSVFDAHTDGFFSMMATFDKCAKYTAPAKAA